MNLHQPLVLARRLLLFAAAFMVVSCAFADFPSWLVIDGAPYSGSAQQDLSYNQCYEFDTPGGVLLLHANGEVDWGSSLASILESPDLVGSSDGSLNVSLEGHQISFPQLIVYPASSQFCGILCYDGTQRSPSAYRWDDSGRLVESFSDLPDGCVFTFDSSSFYRYRAGASMVIDAGAGWPPSSLVSFPSVFTAEGFSGTATQVSESLATPYQSPGYYARCGYSAPGFNGELSITITPSGTTADYYAWGDGYDVSGSWDPASGAPSLPGQSPGVGPQMISWSGFLVPFRFRTADGSDYYDDIMGHQITISPAGLVSATGPYGSDYGSYSTQTMQFSMWVFSLAAVTSDGLSFLGLPPGVTVTTSPDGPGPLNSGNSSNAHTPDYVLVRSDGRVVSKYVGLTPVVYFSIADSPWYAYTGGEVSFDLSSGASWPASNVPVLPARIYANGAVYDCTGTSAGGGPGNFWDYTWYASSGGGSAVISFGDSNGSSWQNAYFSTPQGGFGGQVDPFSFALSGFPAGFSLTIGSAFTSPAFGPPQLVAYGQTLSYAGADGEGRDLYQAGASGAQMTIDSSGNATLYTGESGPVLGATINGHYDAGTGLFDLNDPNPTSCVALDGNGNPIGLPAGLTLFFGADGFAQILALGDSSTLNPANSSPLRFLRSSPLTWGVKYLGLAEGTLFIVSDNAGALASPIYRYHSGGSDDVIDASSFGWPASNLYPDQLYVNGDLALPNPGTLWEYSSGNLRSGSLSYLIQRTGESLAIAFEWDGGFTATVNGTYAGFGAFQGGVWDGGKLFGGLPSGLVITLEPLPGTPHLGPPRIQWDGMDFTFDPIASAVSGSNPTGKDVYRDALGLSLSIAIADNGGGGGAVTLTRADGAQETGTYDPLTGKFTVSGVGAGSLSALNDKGTPYDPSGTNAAAGGSLGAPGETTNILGNLDIHGSSLTLGTWTDSHNNPTNGLGLNFANASGNQPAVLDFSAVRATTDWTWSHSTIDGGSQHTTAMRVDAHHRLILYDPAHPGTPAIILDPAGKSHLEPQGDISMGEFTASPP